MLDNESKKKKEKEDRILREKEELNQMASYNPFGKAGGGAPPKDQNGIVTGNRS